MPNTITEENLMKMIADGRGKKLVVKSQQGEAAGQGQAEAPHSEVSLHPDGSQC